MNKIKLAFLLFLLNICPLIAEVNPSIEIRSGGFIHTSDLFRDIYGTVAPFYELEVGLGLCDCFELWANIDWSPKDGYSLGLDSRTKSNIYNLSVGFNFPINLCTCFTPYLGLGASFSEIHLKNFSPCGTEKTKKSAAGLVVKSGIYYCFTPCVFFDLFVDYLYQPVHFSERHVDIGGFKIGVGIGFNL